MERLNGKITNKKCLKRLDHTDWSAVDYEVMISITLYIISVVHNNVGGTKFWGF